MDHEEYHEPNPEPNPMDGKLTRMHFFGEIHDDFRPNMSKPHHAYITAIVLFQFEGHGYYGQAYVSSLKFENGMLVPDEQIHPIKVDVENKAFLIMEPDVGSKFEFNIKDRIKVENIDSMVDKVIWAIVQEPLGTLDFRMQENPDEGEFWKDKKDGGWLNDPDWWRKGIKPE